MRQCPTREGEFQPLIAHRISPANCAALQGEHFHKCHRCIYRGRALDFEFAEPDLSDLNGQAHTNGVARPIRSVAKVDRATDEAELAAGA